jgi:tetratricopeptide (TPR) repeat protein
MKALLALALLVGAFVLVPAALAQDAPDQPQRPPSPFEEEALRKWQDLSQQAQGAHSAGEYDKAIELYKVAIETIDFGPPAVNSAYNMACAYALSGKTEDALTWLEKSVDLGYGDLGHMRMDKDLVSLRETARFKRLQESMSWNEEVAIHVPEGVDTTTPLPVVVALHVAMRFEAQPWTG